MVICSQQKRRHLETDSVALDVNGEILGQTKSTPYVGVELDECLQFRHQLEKQVSKINCSVGVLKRVSPFVPMATRKTHNTIVQPHFDYCLPVWSVLPYKYLVRLQRAENRCLRIILQCDRRPHVHPMLKFEHTKFESAHLLQ